MDPFGQIVKIDPKLEEFYTLLRDFDHFENTFLPPFPFDPKNIDNQYIDLNHLDEFPGAEIAMQENTVDSVHVAGGPPTVTNMSCDIQGQCVGHLTTQTNVEPRVGNNGKNWITRRRFRKDTKQKTLTKEERNIKCRAAARKTAERKKAHLLRMEAEVQRLHREKAVCTKLLQFLSENQKVGARTQLQRTVSAPI